jgi:hypothetical protein
MLGSMSSSFKTKDIIVLRPSFTWLLALSFVIATVTANASGEPAAQPLSWKALPPTYHARETEFSGFFATGRIYEIDRSRSSVLVASD